MSNDQPSVDAMIAVTARRSDKAIGCAPSIANAAGSAAAPAARCRNRRRRNCIMMVPFLKCWRANAGVADTGDPNQRRFSIPTASHPGVSGELILLSVGQSRHHRARLRTGVSDALPAVFCSRLGDWRRTPLSGQATANKRARSRDLSALATRHMRRSRKRSYVHRGRILRRLDGGITGLASRQSLPESRGRREPVGRCFGDPLLLDTGGTSGLRQ
jgi:hypothetical protein